jgi:hypothetical protein
MGWCTGNALNLYSGVAGFESRRDTNNSGNGFPQSLQANARVPRLGYYRISKHFPIHCSLQRTTQRYTK